jgi:radical SAM superfamily enzyme YgiQ (UPF0313 family)
MNSDKPRLLLVSATIKRKSPRQFLPPPTGLYRIKSYLELNGFSVDVMDTNLFPDVEAEFSTLLARENYDVVGFSITHPSLENDLNLIQMAAQATPRPLILSGGFETILNYRELVPFGWIDLFVLGLGEMPVLEILRSYIPDTK